ncbi:MAG: Gfo/Idh/MocA family oxidoreductase [Massilibacteroides sp.]|nr:Gfo/Idh/MocA family oxidoreductase [Massilibacteroides sp.]MDD3061733.1 Gfo/Idh/MocA family oxidoreductase [Massilibacteroides sp.]MDD4115163.1 Gfo/Idh/MocA family oxidoreductase [Massilibacteroides sp.]MDD4660616.1 Gfo/Idh/MocA family oxidoreductase [Massilibacteroides sp.]
MENTRRSFLKKVTAAGIGAAGLAVANNVAAEVVSTSEVQQKKTSAEKADGKLRFGFIGTGSRCQEHINNVLAIPGNKIVAICDIQQGPLERTLNHIAKFNVPAPKVYTGNEREFEKMLNNEEFDCVIIASPWEWHVPMSVAAMKAGVPYVGVEVSAANTVEECWDLVNVSEATGSQLNIMENVCYRRDCMAALNMVRQGLFGEILHGTCGYQHDLRDVKFNDGKSYSYKEGGELRMGPTAFAEAQWRTQHSVTRNGDIYPTHGIGPVANCLDINRGNRFLSLSAMATQSRGLHKFIVDKGGRDHELAGIRFNLGDIVTSMIKCANGQTVIVTHDTNSPRPYSLGFRVQGTEGLWMNDGNHVYVEGQSKPHAWDDSEEWFKKYDHKLWSTLEVQAREAGHGGMDYIMMYDLIDAIRNKKPAPMDCYDAAAWSAISGLSEMSIARGGALVDFPDFTRGQWIHRKSKFAI